MVRELKSQKADKSKIGAEVKTLLALKAEYKAQTGSDWIPIDVKPIALATQANFRNIVDKGVEKGGLVRDLKAKKSDKSQIDAEVKTLFALKAECKAQTGCEYKPGAAPPATSTEKVTEIVSKPTQSLLIASKTVKQGDSMRDQKIQIEAEVKTVFTKPHKITCNVNNPPVGKIIFHILIFINSLFTLRLSFL